jgi:hypothetical protein
MHLMVWDNEMDMMRGLTFFEPEIPKYDSYDACVKRGTKIIARAIENFKKIKIKTGEWEITCIELKGEKA